MTTDEAVAAIVTRNPDLVKQLVAAALSNPEIRDSVLRRSGLLPTTPNAAKNSSTAAPPTPVAAPRAVTSPVAVTSPRTVPPTPDSATGSAVNNVVELSDGSKAVFTRDEDKQILLTLKACKGVLSREIFAKASEAIGHSKTESQIEIRCKQLLQLLSRPK